MSPFVLWRTGGGTAAAESHRDGDRVVTLPNCRPFNGIRVHENQDDMRSAPDRAAVRAGERARRSRRRAAEQSKQDVLASLAMKIFLVECSEVTHLS